MYRISPACVFFRSQGCSLVVASIFVLAHNLLVLTCLYCNKLTTIVLCTLPESLAPILAKLSLSVRLGGTDRCVLSVNFQLLLRFLHLASPPYSPHSPKMAVVRMPAWSTVLVGSVATALMQTESSSQLLSILKKAFVLLLVLNWRALPFAWHIGESSLKRVEKTEADCLFGFALASCLVEFWGLIPKLYYKIWTKGPKRAMAIGRNPYEVKTVTKGRVRWSDTDYNMQ